MQRPPQVEDGTAVLSVVMCTWVHGVRHESRNDVSAGTIACACRDGPSGAYVLAREPPRRCQGVLWFERAAAAMQQNFNAALLLNIAVQLSLLFALHLASAQSSCTPRCVDGEQCQEVLNTNGQYACVAVRSPSLAVANSSVTSPIATASANSSSAPTVCRSCDDGQICTQVYNADEYHCVSNATQSATSRTTSPAPAAAVPNGCQDCSLSQLCQQVYNTDQYHCVKKSTEVAAPAPSTSVALSNNSDQDLAVSSSPCNPACSDNESCQQGLNSKQYACQPIRSPAGPASQSPPVTAAPIKPSLGDPAMTHEAANSATSRAGLSGAQMLAVTHGHNNLLQHLCCRADDWPWPAL